jgi:hypothetical protein
MTENDKEGFATVLAGVYALYRVELSDSVLGMWWAAMQGFELQAVRVALGRHCMNPDSGQFLPKPADVVKMLGGTTGDSALVAASKLEDTLKHVGTYMTVVFDDPLIHRVVDEMGGWIELGKVTAKDWQFRRTEFVARYRGYKARGEVPAYPARLVGIVDAENGVKGYQVDDTNLRLVGELKVAMAVLQGGSSMPRLPVSVGAAAAALLEDKT